MIAPRPGGRARALTACVLVAVALGGCGTGSSPPGTGATAPAQPKASQHAPAATTTGQSASGVDTTVVGSAPPLRGGTTTSSAPPPAAGARPPAATAHWHTTGTATTGPVAPVTRGAVPAAVVRRVRRACETAPPVMQARAGAGTERSTTAKQTAAAMLPRARALQQGVIAVLAKASQNTAAGALLSPLVQAVGRLQGLLQDAAQGQRSASVAEIQGVAQQLDLTVRRMGLPQCAIAASGRGG